VINDYRPDGGLQTKTPTDHHPLTN
jgi:hypothetical protein